MAIVKAKPTSPGRRGVVQVKHEHLHKGAPHAALLEKKSRKGGRNNTGRMTVRHRGGGHKKHYRVIDFKRDKDGIPGKIERIEHDPNRTAHIALVLYADGERRYIIAPKGLRSGDSVKSGRDASIKPGNCLPLRNIPVGTVVHNVELYKGRGGQIARSAGTSALGPARRRSLTALSSSVPERDELRRSSSFMTDSPLRALRRPHWAAHRPRETGRPRERPASAPNGAWPGGRPEARPLPEGTDRRRCHRVSCRRAQAGAARKTWFGR